MQILIDILGSTIVAGMILASVVGLNGSLTDTAFQTTLDVNTQENSKAIADMITNDFYKIAYHDTWNPVSPAIQLADSEHILFRSDIDNDGVVDTIEYLTSAPMDSAKGTSIRFKRLFRKQNSEGGGDGARLGLTTFKLGYYDGYGSKISLWSPTLDTIGLLNIRSVRVQMFVRNPVALDTTALATYDSTLAAVYWENYISPKNLCTLK